MYFGDHDPSGLDMVRDISDRILNFMRNGERKWSSEDEMFSWWRTNVDNLEDRYYSDEYQIKDENNPGQKTTDFWRVFFENHFEIKAIGLTMEQIQEYKPPHNPAKITDPRAKGYIEQFGQKSWEVDALTPAVMTDIVEFAIEKEIDLTQYDKILQREEEGKKTIKKLIDGLNK